MIASKRLEDSEEIYVKEKKKKTLIKEDIHFFNSSDFNVKKI